MDNYYYFNDDRIVNLDIEENIRQILFKHSQSLNTLADRIYDKKVVFDEGTTLPIINLYSGEDTNKARLFEKGDLIDYFSYGLFMFISEKLKSIFDHFHVEAFYSPAKITLDEANIFDNYYLFCPKIAINAINYQTSIFSVESNNDSTVSKIEKLILDSNTIPSDIHMFILANTYQNIRVIHRLDLKS